MRYWLFAVYAVPRERVLRIKVCAVLALLVETDALSWLRFTIGKGRGR